MRAGDLARRRGIVVRHVGCGVVAAVLELDVEPTSELVNVEFRGAPIDSDLLTDPAGLVGGELATL
jgi:hypothetical protein